MKARLMPNTTRGVEGGVWGVNMISIHRESGRIILMIPKLSALHDCFWIVYKRQIRVGVSQT